MGSIDRLMKMAEDTFNKNTNMQGVCPHCSQQIKIEDFMDD